MPYQVTITEVVHGVSGGNYSVQTILHDSAGAVVASSPTLSFVVPADAPPAAPVADMPTAVIV